MFSRTAASLALLAVAGVVSAQDPHPSFIFKCDVPGVFALTFDDGPAGATADLLDILKKEKVPATFFVNGVRIEGHPEEQSFMERAFKEGHQLASHTYSHKDLNQMTEAEIEKEMLSLEDMVNGIVGERMTYMRPPFGNCNERCAGVMDKLGYKVIQWDLDSNDWKDSELSKKERNAVNYGPMYKAEIAKGATLSLQHDVYKWSVGSVPQIIKEVKAAGLKPVTMENCLRNAQPAYRNGKAPVTPDAKDDAATGARPGAGGKGGVEVVTEEVVVPGQKEGSAKGLPGSASSLGVGAFAATLASFLML